MGDGNNRECMQPNESERRFYNIDQALKEMSTRVGSVETRAVVYNEQIKMIFNNLEDIKQSLREVQKSVVELEKKPADLSQKIFIGVLTSIITTLLMLGLRFVQ